VRLCAPLCAFVRICAPLCAFVRLCAPSCAFVRFVRFSGISPEFSGASFGEIPECPRLTPSGIEFLRNFSESSSEEFRDVRGAPIWMTRKSRDSNKLTAFLVINRPFSDDPERSLPRMTRKSRDSTKFTVFLIINQPFGGQPAKCGPQIAISRKISDFPGNRENRGNLRGPPGNREIPGIRSARVRSVRFSQKLPGNFCPDFREISVIPKKYQKNRGNFPRSYSFFSRCFPGSNTKKNCKRGGR
jgi:hypothetical protein